MQPQRQCAFDIACVARLRGFKSLLAPHFNISICFLGDFNISIRCQQRDYIIFPSKRDYIINKQKMSTKGREQTMLLSSILTF